MARPDVTVVVPTRDRPASLARCLAALSRQQGRDRLEIVVVDDGSRDAGAVAAAAEGVPGARLVRLDGRGPAAARNAGVAAASAELVCLTDDDCEPVGEWAARLAARLRDGAEAAAGPTVAARPENRLALATQTIIDYLTTPPADRPSRVSFAPTSNLAATAAVLEALPFDERFERYGEDRDWCARLAASGRSVTWVPEAVVRHHQELTLASFLRVHAGYGRGSCRFRHAQAAHRRLEPAGFYAGLVRAGFQHGLAVGGLVLLAQLATAAGYAGQTLAERSR